MEQALTRLSNQQLQTNLENLVRKEKVTTTEILLHLNEIENRRLHLALGYNSLFHYATAKLKYSEGAATRRIISARATKDYPQVLPLLRQGKLSLCSLSSVASVLTEEYVDELLAEAAGKSRAEVERIVARSRAPLRREIRDQIKPVYVAKSKETRAIEAPFMLKHNNRAVEKASNSLRNHSGGDKNGVGTCGVEEFVKFAFAGSRDFGKKVVKMKELLSGKYPRGASLEELFAEALDFYIAKHSSQGNKKKQTAKEKVRAQRPRVQATARYIPAQVREEAFKRDKHCCSFKAPDGKVCGSRWDLELDHIVPFSLGGQSTVQNLRVLCAKHNRFEAEQKLGRYFMERFSCQSPAPQQLSTG